MWQSMHLLRSLAVMIALIGSIASAADPNFFLNFSLPNPASTTPLLPGRLFVPAEASTGPRPLIIFLHGGGEIGTNNIAQVNLNIDNLFAEAIRRGAFLYAPQSTGAWSSQTITDHVMTMVGRSLTEFNVDARRIYATGLSNGGGGTWNLLNRYGTIAAGVPICGIPPASDFLPANLLDTPVWAYHARNDGTVGVANSRNRVNSILAAAGEPAFIYPAGATPPDNHYDAATLDLHYTEYYNGGHNIWSRVYNGTANRAMYDWMFSQALIPEPTAAMLAAVGLVAAVVRRQKSRHPRRDALPRRRQSTRWSAARAAATAARVHAAAAHPAESAPQS